MSKKFNVFLSALFCTFIGGVFVLSLLLPDKDFSPLENRYLQSVPTVSLDALKDGSFMAEAEDYAADHIVGRDFWVALKAWSERLSGKQENNGVYFGRNDTLINHLAQPDMDELNKKADHVSTLADNVDVPVYFGLIPSAAEVWRDRLPHSGTPTADEQAIIQTLAARAETDGPVKVLDALSAHSDEDIYYRTDHHWTSLGAYYGYLAVMDAVGMEPVKLEDYEKTTVSTDFYGTIFSSSGVRWVKPDDMDVYVPEEGISVTSYFDGTPTEGELYVEKYLAEKDKYSYFLGGNQPLCVVKGRDPDAPRLLLIRDSYADAMVPFLAESFSEVHLFDLRYNIMSVPDYVTQNGIDQTVVLYSLSSFITDNHTFLMAR